MADRSPGLMVALAAGVLLVAVVAADAAVTRTVALEVEADDGWHTLATTDSERPPSLRPGDGVLLERNRSDDVTFRLTVDNEVPWAYEERFTVTSHGPQVASGTLAAEARGTGEAAFTVPVEELARDQGPRPEDRWFVHLDADVDGERLSGGFEIREVSR